MAARFKELCLDVHAPAGEQAGEDLGRFWAAVTGCAFRPDEGGGPGGVVGPEEGMGIAICPVPEPRGAKNRVHLDVHVSSLEEITVAGGALVEAFSRWTVCADPEGGELCAFVRDRELPTYRTYEMGIDSADAESIARWWGDVFGLEPRNDGEPEWSLQGIPGVPFEAWVFASVPEPKSVKNRMHWDVYGDPQDFLSRGATHLWDTPHWVVLADPEGNEFCVFPEP